MPSKVRNTGVKTQSVVCGSVACSAPAASVPMQGGVEHVTDGDVPVLAEKGSEAPSSR